MNLRPLVVTGPIGSGKSTVSKLLESFGALRVDLDQLSKEALETAEGFEFVSAKWPQVVEHGGINRALLASTVFTDPAQLRVLEAFIHPLVIARFRERFTTKPDLALEVSVPFAISIEDSAVLVVDAPQQTRFVRLRERGMVENDINARMRMQPERGRWLELANFVVRNHGEEEELSGRLRPFWTWWTSL